MRMAAVLAFALWSAPAIALDEAEALRRLNGEWQGRTIPIVLKVDAAKRHVLLLDGGRRFEGNIASAEIVAETMVIDIGERTLTIFFDLRNPGRASLSPEEGVGTYSIQKVK